VSVDRNAALLGADDCCMQARPTDSRPLPLPESPSRIVTVGSCPYFDYDGTGVVDLSLGEKTGHLRILPDVERLQHAPVGKPKTPLTKLYQNPHSIRLSMAGWADVGVECRIGGRWQLLVRASA